VAAYKEAMMKHMTHTLGAGLAILLAGSYVSLAQQPPAGPPPPMSFFVTSAGSGKGADLGGIAGADRICQTLATAAGSSKAWHAYLSAASANGQAVVNARDRIGAGPWFNAKGARIAQNVADLHGDTLESARRGNNISKATALNEKGDPINGVGDTPNQHDMITGSQLDGTAFTDAADHTCGNYSSSAATGVVQLGHHDRTGGGNTSWNSTHPSRGCSQDNLVATGGAGRFYCFAIN
jgi:hypothetical protein